MTDQRLTRDRLEILLCYVLMSAAGLVTYFRLEDWDGISRLLAADVVMTLVSFLLSLYKRNSSVYDAYWSVIPFLFLVLWHSVMDVQWDAYQYAAAAVVTAWSFRLTWNWYRGWKGWSHEDWRYVDFRRRMGGRFVWMNLFGLHLYPTLVVFAAMLPCFSIFSGAFEASLLPYCAGLALSATGVWFEWSADETLHRARNSEGWRSDSVLREGLWKYSRNPNYLGEMLFWCGLAMAGLSAGAPWWSSAGAVAIVVMFLTATIPMKERRLEALRGEAFRVYKNEVSRVIPMPPRESAKGND